MPKKKWSLFGKKDSGTPIAKIEPSLTEQQITESDAFLWQSGATVSTLLGTGKKSARDRTAIYQKWTEMEATPLVSSALRLHVMAALAGDPETGDSIYIETRPGFEKDKEAVKVVEELQDNIQPLLNEVASSVCYNAIAFGDGFGRVYADQKRGVHHILADELVRTPLILPFERGGKTVGYVAYNDGKPTDRLTLLQMARMKMPRSTSWVPQNAVLEKSYRMNLAEDDLDNLATLPAMVGGSLLYSAEDPYDDLKKALLGLVGQRWVDSLDEQILTLNMESMNKDQQERFLKSIKDMLTRSKLLAEKATKAGEPTLERIRHLIPVWGEKGMAAMQGLTAARALTVTTEDVMFHAKTLVGSLGTDLSQVGWADILAGGLGEGGYFRTSAQIAESSGNIRKAFNAFDRQVIDIHTYHRYKRVYTSKDAPFVLKFYGTVSALENEKQNTRLQAMNSGGMLAASMQQFKDMGATEEQMIMFLTKQMLLDEEEAKVYAKIVSAPDAGGGDMGDGFGMDQGGFPGGHDGGKLDAMRAKLKPKQPKQEGIDDSSGDSDDSGASE